MTDVRLDELLLHAHEQLLRRHSTCRVDLDFGEAETFTVRGNEALLLSAVPAEAQSFQQMWMGRVARPPADNEEASVYWEDKWDARGKRFKPHEVSCAHRTESKKIFHGVFQLCTHI